MIAKCLNLRRIRLTVRLTIFDTITARLFNDSFKIHMYVLRSRRHGSICHLKFPKVILAHVLGKVRNFGKVLLSISSRTGLPSFIEIGLYLTDTEQKF